MAETAVKELPQLKIELTQAAIVQLKRHLAGQPDPNTKVRVGVEGGGCSGLQYILKFDPQTNQHDKVFDFEGVPVVVDLRSLLYLNGTVLDYTGDLLGGGFKFNNPKAKRSCGCGTSFSV